MPMRGELAVSKTRSVGTTAIDREFWIIVAFCTIGLVATMYFFDHLPFLLSNPIALG